MTEEIKSKRRGRPIGTDTVSRVTVRLTNVYYNQVIQKMLAEKRSTVADTVRVIIQEYFDNKKEESKQ